MSLVRRVTFLAFPQIIRKIRSAVFISQHTYFGTGNISAFFEEKRYNLNLGLSHITLLARRVGY